MDKKVVMVVMVILMVVSLFFAWQGVSMHKQVSTQEASFHALQNDYFSLESLKSEIHPKMEIGVVKIPGNIIR